MPAMLDDPTSPAIFRVSGAPPYPTPNDPKLPLTIVPRQVTLRDHITIATLIPISSASQVPPSLLSYLSDQMNREIIKGDTYPMMTPMPVGIFGEHWFQNFGAVMILGEVHSVEHIEQMENNGTDWSVVCLGSFYVKPNYPGRSSHICNGGFLVTDAARNKGVGRLMGEGYLEWAPKLGYTYSVFNLVYETNVASCRIWDALGFKRIGRVPNCGNLRSHPNELVDAIIYGRDLGPEGEDFVSEERFDKIRYYLKHQKYPAGANRAEKSRLRSAATHYKLITTDDGSDYDRLMLKDKEVIADPQRQYEVARQVHAQGHGGINKTTATIAEKYHWVRIKETVSLVIKNCPDCKEIGKAPTVRPEGGNVIGRRANGGSSANQQDPNQAIERLVTFEEQPSQNQRPRRTRTSPSQGNTSGPQPGQHHVVHGEHIRAPVAPMHNYGDMPLDPQMMSDPQLSQHRLTPYQNHHGDTSGGRGFGGFTLDMDVDQGGVGGGARLATEGHVRHGNDPMGYQIEGPVPEEMQDDVDPNEADAVMQAM